jgi:hypothetical protein
MAKLGQKLGRISVVITAAALVGLSALGGCEQTGGTMAILDVQPKVGHTQGEQPIRILGQNFRNDIGYTIFFGTKPSGSVTIRDSETLDVVTPPGMPVGKVDIMIRSDDGSAFRIKEGFAFEDMGGSVVGGLGGPGGPAKGEQKGNLAY